MHLCQIYHAYLVQSIIGVDRFNSVTLMQLTQDIFIYMSLYIYVQFVFTSLILTVVIHTLAYTGKLYRDIAYTF